MSCTFLVLCLALMGLSVFELLQGAAEPRPVWAMLGTSIVLTGCFSWIIARNRNLQERADTIARLME